MVPVWRTTPGPAMVVAMWQTPTAVRSAPTTPETIPGASTPFCTVSTVVSGPTSARLARTAPSRSHSLAVTTTRSTGPIASARSVARTRSTATGATGLSTVRPRSRIAARCAPRATNDTSAPAFARLPPK